MRFNLLHLEQEFSSSTAVFYSMFHSETHWAVSTDTRFSTTYCNFRLMLVMRKTQLFQTLCSLKLLFEQLNFHIRITWGILKGCVLYGVVEQRTVIFILQCCPYLSSAWGRGFHAFVPLCLWAQFYSAYKKYDKDRILSFSCQVRGVVPAFISHCLDYCNALLSSLPKKSISSLQLLQNSAATVLKCEISELLKGTRALAYPQRLLREVHNTQAI